MAIALRDCECRSTLAVQIWEDEKGAANDA